MSCERHTRSEARGERTSAKLRRLIPATLALLPAMIALGAAPLQAFEAKDCLEAETSTTAIRACTDLVGQSDAAADVRLRAFIRRGEAWLKEEEPKEAVADFARAIELDPKDAKARSGRAAALTALGEHKKAAEDWGALIAAAADEATAERHYLSRAASWLAEGDTEAALADYTKATALNPKGIMGYIGRANVHAATGNKEKALADYAAAEAIEPTNTAIHVARAEAAEKWGDVKLAIENYTFVVKNNTRSAGPSRQALRRLGVDNVP